MAELVIKLVNGELAGKTAQSIAKEINAAATAAKKAEVGTKEWIDAHAKLNNAKKLQEDLRQQVQATTSASDELKSSWGGVLDMIPGFSQVSGIMGQAKSGVGGLSVGFRGLGSAIAMTGIGLLVIAIITLVDWFRKTDEGATLLGGIMRGLGAIVEKLMAGIRAFGGVLVDAFNNPKQAAKDFIEFLKNQVMNRINSFGVAMSALKKIMAGDFKEGFLELGDAVIQFQLGITDGTRKLAEFGKEIADTVREGIALETELDRIADRARELGVMQAQTKKDVDQLLLQAKNVSKSYEERLALLDRAGAIERKNHQEQLVNARDLEAAMLREVAAKQLTGNVTDELDQQLKDAQIARINLENESINLQEKIENRRQQLMEKQAAERQRDLDKLKKLEEERFKIIQEIEDRSLEAKDAGREKDLEALSLTLRRQIEEIDSNSPFYAERIAAAQELARQKRDEINQKWDQVDLDNALQSDLNILNERFLAGEINETAFAQQTADRVMRFEQARMDLLKSSLGEESAEYQKAYAKFLELKKKYADESAKVQKKISDDELSAITGSLNVMAGFMGNLGSLYEQGTQQFKAFAVAAAIMSTIEGAINAYTSALKIPFVGGALAPIAAAAALAAGYARVRQIQNTKVSSPVSGGGATVKPVKRELGGPLYGPRHSQGGIPIEAEGGEFIFSRKAAKAIGMNRLAEVNDHFTRKFATGGPVDPFMQGRQTPSAPTMENSALVEEFRAFRNEVSMWQKNFKVYNLVQETEAEMKKVQNIRNEADV